MLKNTSKKITYTTLAAFLFTTTAIAAVVAQQQVTAPASVVSDNSVSNFTVDSSNGEITNTKDGLVWTSCFVGQTFNKGNCEGEATEFNNWADALASVTNEQKKQGWRVPNIKELMHITDNTKAYPAVDESAFAFASSLTFNEDDGWSGGFKSGSSPYVWSSTPVRHKTNRIDGNYRPLLKTDSVTKTAEDAKEADRVYALDLAYGQHIKAYRDGKSRGEHQATDTFKPDPDHVEKARYVLLVKTAS